MCLGYFVRRSPIEWKCGFRQRSLFENKMFLVKWWNDFSRPHPRSSWADKCFWKKLDSIFFVVSTIEKHFEHNAFPLFLASPARCAVRSVNTFGVSPFLAWHATSQGFKTCRKFIHKTFGLQKSQLLSHLLDSTRQTLWTQWLPAVFFLSAVRSVNTFGVSPSLAWRATSQGKTFTHKTFGLQKSQLLSHHELLQSLADKCGWDHVNHFRNLQNEKNQCNKDIHEVLQSQHAGQVATSGLHSPTSRLLWATFGVSFPAEQAWHVSAAVCREDESGIYWPAPSKPLSRSRAKV